jgi:hypothetical protein
MTLHERLGLKTSMWDPTHKIEAVELAKQVPSNASDYDRAWTKFGVPADRNRLTLAYYYCDNHELVKEHAAQCITELEEFFFGEWRNTFETPEMTLDARWWKRRFVWMQLFEAAVLWGSVLGRWHFLKRVSTFPEPDSCISDTYRAVDRDLYVAWAAFLRDSTPAEIDPLLRQVQSGQSRSAKLVLTLLQAGLVRDVGAFQKALNEWLKYYRKEQFPREKITKKITIEGTFFVHWAEKERISVVVPPEFVDHIVRIPEA